LAITSLSTFSEKTTVYHIISHQQPHSHGKSGHQPTSIHSTQPFPFPSLLTSPSHKPNNPHFLRPLRSSMDHLTAPPSRRILGFHVYHWLLIILLFFISFVTRVLFIHYPPVVVFDETHFGNFVSSYLRGVSFFDIHPPLAKLIFTAVSRCIGYTGNFNFSNYNSRYPSDFYVFLRLTPAFFCSFSGPFMTAALLLRRTPIGFAFCSGLLFSLDIISVVQSRFILTDGILYFFVALTFLLTSLVERHDSLILLCFQALSASFAFCVKFTAAGLFVYIAFSHFRILYGRQTWFLLLVLRGILISLIFIISLVILLWIHLKMLPKPGYGDKYFSPTFRKKPRPIQIVLLLEAMYRYNRDLRAQHPAASRWWGWPFFFGPPVVFWSEGTAKVVLISNPVSLFASTIGFVIGWMGNGWIFSVGYAISYFPFILIKRPTFVYHHEIPVMFGIMAFGASSRKVFPPFLHNWIKQGVIVATIFVFLVFSPLVYGIPLEKVLGSWVKGSKT
jgi:dolichyl-phosphate-mannose--protein O-mannosyl transferase